MSTEKIGSNALEAIANGTSDGVKLAVNVAAMLLVFIAFIAMANFILDDKIGVPLFESELLYGIRPELIWDIRLDGQILASEIVGKGV